MFNKKKEIILSEIPKPENDPVIRISLQLRLFMLLIKADGNISNREINSILKYFLMKYGNEVFTEIQSTLETYISLDDSLVSVCKGIKSTFKKEEIKQLILELFTLSFIDGLDNQELEIMDTVCVYLDLVDVYKEYMLFFEKKLSKLNKSNFILTLGSHKDEVDIPIYNSAYTGGFFFIEDKVYLILLKGDDVRINARHVRELQFEPLSPGDSVKVGKSDILIQYNTLKEMIQKKLDPTFTEYSIINHKGSLQLIEGVENTEKIIAYVTFGNLKITIQNISNDNKLIVNNRIVNLEDNPLELFGTYRISYSGFQGEIVFNQIETEKKELNIKTINKQIHEIAITRLKVNDLSCSVKGVQTLQNISFEIHSNKLLAILGPAGSGKSTLLNTLLGKYFDSSGTIEVNNTILKKSLSQIQDHLGFVPQDELLFENLTVRENLFYKYRLKFPYRNESEIEVDKFILSILEKVNLKDRVNSLVGNAEERYLSGGERRRLNIALELITNPDILILDEPTSGLSSQDAEEIILLLKSISEQGKIVLMVIHQPSSTIYRMFDKILILNKNGTQAFFGNPIEALELFQEVGNFSSYIECPTCSNLNPESLLKALKQESIQFWETLYSVYRTIHKSDIKTEEYSYSPLPKPIKLTFKDRVIQFKYQFERNFKCKWRDKLNRIGLPLISFIISIITASMLYYIPDKGSDYSFSNNIHYPTFLFLVVVVGIFFGASNSATDIIKDRLILKRESLMDVSTFGYFFTKFIVLGLFSIVQNILFILPAHIILEEYNMIGVNLFLMTAISLVGISLGLFVSTLVKSLSLAYNLVPMILVPQIILGGALVKYKELNQNMKFEKESPIPEMAQLMISRWGYEMLVTANITLHPRNQLVIEKNREEEEINNTLCNIPESDECLEAKDNITEKYSGLLNKYLNSYNGEIDNLKSLNDYSYLNPENNWFGGKISTWFRNLLVLLSYLLTILTLGYIRLRTTKY